MGIGGLKLSAQERVAELEARLSVRFSRPDLGLSALCHKSWLNEHPREALVDNERLEFLGDAVVDLAIGHRLMERMPEAREGELSRARASLVDERGLGAVAADLGLRSEEHTSELQSRENLVCRLLREQINEVREF